MANQKVSYLGLRLLPDYVVDRNFLLSHIRVQEPLLSQIQIVSELSPRIPDNVAIQLELESCLGRGFCKF
jgi:hypothetical protein